MLERTFVKLGNISPGTFVPDDVDCYDAAEIDEFGAVLSRLVYAPSQIRRRLQEKFGVTITRSDFYSEIPTIAELENAFRKPSLLALDAVFPSNAELVAELRRLKEASIEFDPPVRSSSPREYAWEGGPFSYSDAMSYYSMIRTRKPQTIIEIGSGWSTLIAQMACTANGFGRIVCIEPFPSDALVEMSGIELVRQRAQDIETEFIANNLQDGDILFIDSTHTVKNDSDCLHIYLRLLPGISSIVSIHVHDIYLPNPLSLVNMQDYQIFSNEQYLLYAYMLSNLESGPSTAVIIIGSKIPRC